MNKENIVGRFHGKEVYVVPDKKLDTIILSESLAKYILELQYNTIKNVNQTQRGKRGNLIGFVNNN